MKKKLFFCFCAFFSVFLYANETKFDCAQLLNSYLEHDLTLQKLIIEVSKSELNLKLSKIENGFDISLSTGNMIFYPGNASSDSQITMKPSISAKIPSVKNLTASVSTEYEYKSSSGKNELENTKIAFSVDAISSEELLSKISILKSERSLLEAKRLFQTSSLAAENRFYTELKSILLHINDIFTYFQTLYTDKLHLETLKAQGYSASSSTYRVQEMKVSSGEHDIETALHNLRLEFIVFYQHCGIKIDFTDEKKFMDFVPENIPVVEALSFSDYDKENFSEIENAKWVHKINEMIRASDNFFSLGVNAGYTVKNSSTSSDTLDAGISVAVGGVSLGSALSFPLGLEGFSPAVSVSMAVSPNSFRKKSITKEQNSLSSKQEQLDIQEAYDDYETSLIAYNQTCVNLEWEKNSVAENFALYKKNESDLYKYYKDGIVSESEALSAKNNRQLYEIKILINRLEYILYNNEVLSEFVPAN